MRSVETKIFRPVSLPPQLAGAPMGPAVTNLIFGVMLFILASVMDFPFPPLFIFFSIGIHITLWSYYQREPHLTTLIATWWKSTRRVSSLGPRSEPDYNP